VKNLKLIREEWKDCVKCPLSEGRHGSKDGAACRRCSASKEEVRHHVVVGEGSSQADVMIIGEAPGEWEDRSGVPFIGESGDVLTSLLNNAKLLKRELTEKEAGDLLEGALGGNTIRKVRSRLFITNLVACRPPNNRDPNLSEMLSCWPRVAAQIYAIDPLLIIAVGKVASSFLLGRNVAITEMRGSIVEAKVPGLVGDYTVPVLPILHPAYLMRNFDTREGGIWDKTQRDLELAKDVIDAALAAYRGENVC
jgi:DNA polymerase